jgi:hypothetical protein
LNQIFSEEAPGVNISAAETVVTFGCSQGDRIRRIFAFWANFSFGRIFASCAIFSSGSFLQITEA